LDLNYQTGNPAEEFLSQVLMTKIEMMTVADETKLVLAEKETAPVEADKKPDINRKVVIFMFFVIAVMNLIANFDQGILPAGTIVIAKDLGMDKMQYGLLGSAEFGGLVIGK
jgi:hypothetical protein